MRVSSFSLLAVAMLCLSPGISRVHGDAGVYTGNGQNLRQSTSKNVQLVSINVVIIPGRGRFLFDGSVPGMDEAEYSCTFVLRNLSDVAEEIQVGFPIDSDFVPWSAPLGELNVREQLRPTPRWDRFGIDSNYFLPAPEPDAKTDPMQEAQTWVRNYGFTARDQSTTYHVGFVRQPSSEKKDVARAIFNWKMNFAPKETRTLEVNYHMPISLIAASTAKDQQAAPRRDQKRWMASLEGAILGRLGYITETGSTWAGNVQSARFVVLTGPFERYLSYRGSEESPADELSAEELASRKRAGLIQQAWWYREMLPAGGKSDAQRMIWEYKDFKPKDAVTVSYFMTRFPRVPEAAGPFVDSLLSKMSAPERKNARAEMGIAREILLATWGQEPTDAAALTFAKDQAWYQPKKDFALSQLSANQKAVLDELDRKASLVDQGK